MSQRNNRPKVQGGFNFFDWYNQNKNNVTKLGAGGFEVKAPGASSSPKPAATAQPPESSGGNVGVVRIGGKSYNMSDPKQKAAYEKAQKAELDRQRGRSPFADIRGTSVERTDVTGRSDVRKNAYDLEQTGTLMGSRAMTMDEANKLLTGGYQVMNPFASNQLPASASDLYGKNGYQAPEVDIIPENMYSVKPKFMGKNLDIDLGPFETGAIPEDYMSGVEIQSEMLRGSPNIAQGGAAETAVSVTSATDTPKSSIPSRPQGGRQAEMWDRKYGRQVNQPEREKSDLEKEYSPDMERRRAFLDADSSLQGLRRVEAQKGVVYAGNTYNMVNPNQGQEGEKDFIQISKEDRDGYIGGKQSAEDLKKKYVDKITAANAGQNASAVTPADT